MIVVNAEPGHSDDSDIKMNRVIQELRKAVNRLLATNLGRLLALHRN